MNLLDALKATITPEEIKEMNVYYDKLVEAAGSKENANNILVEKAKQIYSQINSLEETIEENYKSIEYKRSENILIHHKEILSLQNQLKDKEVESLKLQIELEKLKRLSANSPELVHVNNEGAGASSSTCAFL